MNMINDFVNDGISYVINTSLGFLFSFAIIFISSRIAHTFINMNNTTIYYVP